MGRGVRSPDPMAARADRIILAAGEHRRWAPSRSRSAAPPARAHRRACSARFGLVLLIIWIGANLGVIAAFPLSPLYFYLMMYPFWAFFSLYAGVSLLEHHDARLGARRDCAIPLGLRHALRGGCRTRSAVPRRCFARVQVERRPRAAPRRRSRKLCSGKSRCGPVRSTAARSPRSSARRGVRCGSDCSKMPSGR